MDPVHLDFDDRPIRDHTISSLLETRATWFGEDPFLYYGHDSSQVSFEEANGTANAIANSLRDRGVEKGQNVSIMVENQLEAVLAMYGIHKSGAVFAPLNYEYRGDVLSYQVNDVSPEVLVVEDQFVPALNDVADELENPPHLVVSDSEVDDTVRSPDDVFTVDSFDELKDGERANPDVPIAWDDVALITYTSGTTGHPKGVVVPHRWIIYYCAVRWQIMNREDVVHTALPMYHGAGPYWDIAPALVVGCPVALWDRFSPSTFIDRVNEYEATVATLISVMHSWLWDQPEEPDDHRNTLNKVQMSPLPSYHEEMARRFSFDFLTSKFGQQESGNPLTGFVHAAREEHATPPELHRGLSPPEIKQRAELLDIPVVEEVPGDRWIGGPMPWVELQIVNERDEPVGPGEIGQLVVRPAVPAAIFQGYYNRPAKTLEDWGNLWFHVGDAMYYDEEGNYFFVDRMGHVIRRQGENISAEQLESILNQHEAVAEAAALPIPAEAGGEDEIAYVIQTDDDADLTEADLMDFVEPRLAAFMHPDYVRFVDDLPMTDTNKIRKHDLRQQLFDV